MSFQVVRDLFRRSIIVAMISLCEEPEKKFGVSGVNILGSSLQKYTEHKYNIICEKNVKNGLGEDAGLFPGK
jgi:hypothetical protein